MASIAFESFADLGSLSAAFADEAATTAWRELGKSFAPLCVEQIWSRRSLRTKCGQPVRDVSGDEAKQRTTSRSASPRKSTSTNGTS